MAALSYPGGLSPALNWCGPGIGGPTESWFWKRASPGRDGPFPVSPRSPLRLRGQSGTGHGSSGCDLRQKDRMRSPRLMTSDGRKILRCAIYTRKSTERGLEQEFNSLHSQREACEAYIKSQASQGWKALPQH